MKAPIGFIYPKDWSQPSCIAVLVEPKTRDRLNERFTSVAPEMDTDEKINMLIDITENADQSIAFFRSEYESIKVEVQSLQSELKATEDRNNKMLSQCDDLKILLDYTRHQRNLAFMFLAICFVFNLVAMVFH